MSDFVEIKRVDGNLDYVNREFVGRVEAEAVPHSQWVVKVFMSYGTEVIDLRAATREEAEARVAELIGRPPA
jgi:hypothetical protein